MRYITVGEHLPKKTGLCIMAILQHVCILMLCATKSLQERIVPSPPSITAGPKPYPERSWNPELGDRVYVYVEKEKNTRLQCVASGNTPNLRYEWLKDGILIDFTSADRNNTLHIYKEQGLGTLNIHRVQENDYGTYQCRASSTSEKFQAVSLSKKVQLIEADISSFQNIDDRHPRQVALGTYLMLTCNPPPSNPKADLKWSADDSLKEMTLDERIVLDYEGNLHFANVASEDGEKLYSCYASLHFLGFYSKGPSTSLTVIGDKAAFQPAMRKWSSEKHVIGVEGEPAKFMCIFGGYPTPKISWRKAGRTSTLREGSNGHELIISSVQSSDKGIYICSGSNSVTKDPQEVRFTLDVQAKPTWKFQPVDKRVSVGESTSISCKAEGNPIPTVEWYINGNPYKDIPGKRYLQNDVLRVSNLTKRESVVVQCNATNTHGSLFSDVYINVLALPPEITNWTKLLKVATGNDAVLTCSHNGYPTPTLTWIREPQVLNGNRYSRTENSITIHKVNKNDEGNITCISKNTEGEMGKSSMLIVRDKTSITDLNGVPEVDAGRDVIFTCVAKTDPKETIKYLWKKRGTLIKDFADHHISCENNCAVLRIKEAGGKHSGNYTCLASNGIDEDQRTIELKVKAAPNPPVDVKITSCGDWKLGLTWTAGFNNFLPIIDYTVEYSTSFKPKEWVYLSKTTNNNTFISGISLSAWVEYTFRIKAMNSKGFSVPSEPTNICKTDPKKPSRHPEGVKIKNSQEGYLSIEWEAMDHMEHNGDNFEYQIFVRKLNTTDSKSYIVSGDKNSKLIKTNDTYQQYGVKVAARNSKGTPLKEPEEVIGFSGMGVPTIKPRQFALDKKSPFTHEMATFVWDAVSPSSAELKGKFDGYVIRYWKTKSPKNVKRIEIPPRVLSDFSNSVVGSQKIKETVHNLPAYSDLELDVLVKNTMHESKPSNRIKLTTPEGVPSEVEKLKAEKRGENYLELGWFPPKRINGKLMDYKVMFRKVSGGELGKKFIQTKKSNSNVTAVDMVKHRIVGLEPNTLYRVDVLATTKTGAGRKKSVDVMTADRAPLSPPIVYVEMLPEKIGFNVSWKSVSIVNIVNMKESEGTFTEVKRSNSSRNWVVLNEGLEEGRTYVITVTAVDGTRLVTSEEMKVTLSNPALTRENDAIFKATWFIIVMVAIAILILVIIIVCLLLKRNRGDKYNVQERENLHGIKNEEMKKPLPMGDFDEKLASWDFDGI
ncbi:neuroglian-like isoform X2 [Ostrea edulis]|uniref:neuroglian-like isoform X2 n=1 Tax=Ostrea edulis TaxID=37623 RepID=UPI0024AF6AF7|nr:neuroglian-like isoform X2 [Ostrea edulis]